MENNEEEKLKKAYIRKIGCFCMMEKKIEECLKNQINNIDNPFQFYLINKDIISNFKRLYLFSRINNCLNNDHIEKKVLNNYEDFISNVFKNNKIGIDVDKIKNSNKVPAFLEPEKLTINGIEYPYNF